MNWVEKHGDAKVASLLSVSLQAARVWRIGAGLPTARKLYLIKRLSKGALSCDLMIDQYFKSNTAANARSRD